MKLDAFQMPRIERSHDAMPGLAAIAAMVAAELSETITPGQARGFFHEIGRRLAALQPLDEVGGASALGAKINGFWQALDFGEAEIVLQSDAVVVRHRHAPKQTPLVDAARWPMILLAVLEGAYDAWFRQLGSGPNLKTVAEWNGDTVEIRHGA